MPKSAENISKKLEVKVMESEKVLYSGFAESISSDNEVGRFDVLPGHQSFISIIQRNVLIQTNKNQRVQFRIGKGILKCINDKVEVLVGLESLK